MGGRKLEIDAHERNAMTSTRSTGLACRHLLTFMLYIYSSLHLHWYAMTHSQGTGVGWREGDSKKRGGGWEVHRRKKSWYSVLV